MKTVFKHAISVFGSAVVTLSLVWILVGAGQGFELGWNGALPTLKVSAREEALGRAIQAALDDEEEAGHLRAILRARDFFPPDRIPPEQVPRILESQMADHGVFIRATLRDMGFFRVSDPALVTALEELGPDDPMSRGLRQLLFDMTGPFAPPRTLDGAQSRFITDVLEERPANDLLIAEVWSSFIGAHLTFLYPDLEAQLLPDPLLDRGRGSGDRVTTASACSGSHLVGKYVQVWLDGPDGPDPEALPVTLYVGLDAGLPRFRCRDEPLQLIEIAQARRARLGLPRELYDRLAGARAAAGEAAHFNLVVFPTGVSPLDPREF